MGLARRVGWGLVAGVGCAAAYLALVLFWTQSFPSQEILDLWYVPNLTLPVILLAGLARAYPGWKRLALYSALQAMTLLPSFCSMFVLLHVVGNCGGGHCGTPWFGKFDPSVAPFFFGAGFWAGAFWTAERPG